MCAPFGNLRAIPAEQLLGYRVSTKLGVFLRPQYPHPTSKGPCQPGSVSESPGSLLSARFWVRPASESHILGAGSGPCIANKLPESSPPWGSSTQELQTEVFSFHSLLTSRKSHISLTRGTTTVAENAWQPGLFPLLLAEWNRIPSAGIRVGERLPRKRPTFCSSLSTFSAGAQPTWLVLPWPLESSDAPGQMPCHSQAAIPCAETCLLAKRSWDPHHLP